MRRADRLFQIIQLLRGRRVLTARRLAERLEVSERTIYRDVTDLVLSGVPVEGEAGVGYMLRDYDLPPLMFSRAEVEALVLGARIVQSWADPELARAAKDVLSKVETVLPRDRRDLVEGTALYAPSMHHQVPLTVDVAQLRGATRWQEDAYSVHGRENRGYRTDRSSAGAVVLRSRVAPERVVRIAPGLPLFSSRSDRVYGSIGRDLSARTRPYPGGLSESSRARPYSLGSYS